MNLQSLYLSTRTSAVAKKIAQRSDWFAMIFGRLATIVWFAPPKRSRQREILGGEVRSVRGRCMATGRVFPLRRQRPPFSPFLIVPIVRDCVAALEQGRPEAWYKSAFPSSQNQRGRECLTSRRLFLKPRYPYRRHSNYFLQRRSRGHFWREDRPCSYRLRCQLRLRG